jgi:hypothetical protein
MFIQREFESRGVYAKRRGGATDERRSWSGLRIDPQAWLADVLARIASTPQGRINELLPWEWKNSPVQLRPDRATIPRPSPASPDGY